MKVANICRYFISKNSSGPPYEPRYYFRPSVISFRDLSVLSAVLYQICVFTKYGIFNTILYNILKCPSQQKVRNYELGAKLYDYFKLFTDKLAVDITLRVTADPTILNIHISL